MYMFSTTKITMGRIIKQNTIPPTRTRETMTATTCIFMSVGNSKLGTKNDGLGSEELTSRKPRRPARSLSIAETHEARWRAACSWNDAENRGDLMMSLNLA
jgi:hypothetical protein